MSLDALIAPSLRLAGRAMGPRGCLFTFHRAARKLLWDTLPNREFYLNLDFLEDALRYLLAQGWDIVTLDEAMARLQAGQLKRNFVNFSIDDCYRDTFEDVVPLFRKFRVPVTLFVTTGIPDGTLKLKHVGFEDILLHQDRIMLEGAALDVPDAEAKRLAYQRFEGRFEGEGSCSFYQEFCAQNGVYERDIHWRHAASWEMLQALKDDPLVEIGAHTVSHPHLAELSNARAREEMGGSRQRLETMLGQSVRHFAYPYGRRGDCLPENDPLGWELGFASVSTTIKGLVRSGTNPMFLPRNTLNGAHQSLAHLEMHLLGGAALAARMLGRV